MLIQRLENYQKLETLRNSKLLVYVTSDRQNAETNIGSDILPLFSNHLDLIKKSDRISLYLYSNGGSTLAAWSLVNLIKSFCNDFEIIVPFKCQSAATLISLGANRIIMTKQATLGPIDPSTNGPMNPQAIFNGQTIKVPVSVEHVNGYLEMAKNDLNITDHKELKDIYIKLTEYIHPLTLGNVYKSKSQIKMLAEKLLKFHEIAEEDISKVVNFLCSDSGSHDYTINRKEAKEELGLNIEKPNDELYQVIKDIYLDIENELQLRNPHNPNLLLATQNPYPYSLRRGLIESINGGTDVFLSEGTLVKQNNPLGGGGIVINDNKIFESWKHEN
ncbi:serine protease [Chryseobacterium sp.]|uniref:SDH family Clp fold serine proteinase n=1 Tax=Chryseobacterium sp. TaxID=1871047 RepID=UPI000EC830C1|nr:serine protease [Chryseobacterium sp.]HCA06930.1 serine protease [Chryseobacterium sp.]